MQSFTDAAMAQMWATLPDPDAVEHVLALPAFALDGLLSDDGLLTQPTTTLLIQLMRTGWHRWLPRPFAEETETWRQIIPYTIVMQARTMKLLVTHRTKKQVEARLHDKYSLGVGGHVNPEDAGRDHGDALAMIAAGFERELREELNVLQRPDTKAELLGVLNDTTTQVSRVHVGLAFIVTVPLCDDVSVRETDNMVAEWLTPREIAQNGRVHDSLEGWARMVWAYLYNIEHKSTNDAGEIIYHGGPSGCMKPIAMCSCG